MENDIERQQAELFGQQEVPIGIQHEDHVDYLQQGHLHHMREDGLVEEHTIPVSDTNPAECSPEQHRDGHIHGPNCGHQVIPHGGHLDYLVDGRLHHPHGDHCDDHGPVEIVE